MCHALTQRGRESTKTRRSLSIREMRREPSWVEQSQATSPSAHIAIGILLLVPVVNKAEVTNAGPMSVASASRS